MTDQELTLPILHERVAAIAPIYGIEIAGNSYAPQYRPEATAQQRADAQAVIDAFDPAAELQAVDDDRQQRRVTTNQYRQEALIFDNMVSMSEAQVRQWIQVNGAEEALVVIWRVLRFVVSWIRAAERWSDMLKRLR